MTMSMLLSFVMIGYILSLAALSLSRIRAVNITVPISKL
ncbi:Uncharacterised protein [Serratia odorifera]|uniref:Uncharacterized protein n=1 Tax=Serratia odorifera TaxID=618 RepID=A0A3S4FNS8_SEROD|nr:Uncharacterised protein [Serratia odorifera]